MRSYESPYLSDWYVISLRWLAILGLMVSLAQGGQLFQPANLLLAVLAIWNMVLTFITGINRRLIFHRPVSLGIDLFVAGLFFLLQGGMQGVASWVAIIPILSASLYYEFKGGLFTSLFMAALICAGAFLRNFNFPFLFASFYAAILTVIIGMGFGLLGKGATISLRRLRYRNQDTLQRQRRFENDRLRAIYDLTSSLVATLNYQHVLESVLDLSISVMGPDPSTGSENRMVSVVLLFKDNKLTVASARRLSSSEMRQTLPGKKGILCKAIEGGDPILVDNISDDPELSQLISLQACRQLYCFPLRSGFNNYGLLLFGYPAEEFFNQERLETLDILSRQAVIAIQNARLYQNLSDERDRMVEIHEEARKKLARDLHDGPTQSISAIALRVNIARKLLEKDVNKASDEMVKIEDLARRTNTEIRHMLFTLRPLILESQGLAATLQSNAKKIKETFGQEVIIDVDEKFTSEIEMGKQGVIYYLAEEAINNARKHAQAPHIWVKVQPVEKEIALLEVHDDGVGFNLAEIDQGYDGRGSLGMVNLRERTDLVNGYLNILSSPGEGTRVQVYIPLSEDAADRMHRAIGKS